MKLQLFAVLLVVAGSYALPGANVEPSNARNSVEHRIRRFIEGAIRRIEDAGLDPLEVERREIDINIESLDIVLQGFVDNLRFVGASNIRIHTLEYSHLFNRLRLDVSIPQVRLSVGDSAVDVIIGGAKIESQLKGSLSIRSIRVAGVGYVDVSIIGGLSVRSASLDCSIGRVDSDFAVVVQGSDRSELVNDILNNRIPDYLEANKNLINRGLETIITLLLNRIWSF